MEKGRQRKEKQSKGRREQSKKIWLKQLQREYLQVSSCIYDFLASFGMHGTCMCVFGSHPVIGMGFSKCDIGFILSLPFLDSHCVMRLFLLVEIDF